MAIPWRAAGGAMVVSSAVRKRIKRLMRIIEVCLEAVTAVFLWAFFFFAAAGLIPLGILSGMIGETLANFDRWLDED